MTTWEPLPDTARVGDGDVAGDVNKLAAATEQLQNVVDERHDGTTVTIADGQSTEHTLTVDTSGRLRLDGSRVAATPVDLVELEQTLGTDPAGPDTDVATRLQRLDARPTSPRLYGGVADGSHDDTQAIEDCLTAVLPGQVIDFGYGRWTTDGGHRITTPCTIVGAGRHQLYNSDGQIIARNASNSDMFTLATTHVTIRDLTLIGRKATQSGTSRGIVLSTESGEDANYFTFDNVWVDDFNGDNVVLQSPATTLSGIISKLESRFAAGYGLRVAGTASDVQMSTSYIDQNAQSGIYCQASDLALSNVHVWGNGTAGSGLRDGITFASSSGCRLDNCYIEGQHNGAGVRFQTGTMRGHVITGCDIWDNGLQGIYAFGASDLVVASNVIRQNNYSGLSGINGAGITFDTVTGSAVTGNVFFGPSPFRQTYGYAENADTCSHNALTGNVLRAAVHATGAYLVGAGANPTTVTGNVT